jgi:hypothetical protein
VPSCAPEFGRPWLRRDRRALVLHCGTAASGTPRFLRLRSFQPATHPSDMAASKEAVTRCPVSISPNATVLQQTQMDPKPGLIPCVMPYRCS